MADDAEFGEIMERLQSGDQAAATQVFQRFAHRLVGLARSRLAPRVRSKIDPEDIVQSVFRSFFRRHADDEVQLDNAEALWALLALIAVRKCGHKVRHFYAECRDARREMAPAPASAEVSRFWEAIAEDPTPQQAVMLTETVGEVMGQMDERKREIFSLSLQGYKPDEIAQQLNCSDRTVQRALERVRSLLEAMRDDEDAPHA